MNHITINIEKYYFLGSHMLYYISVFNMIKLTFARALALKRNGFQKIYYGEIDVKRDTIIKQQLPFLMKKAITLLEWTELLLNLMLQR